MVNREKWITLTKTTKMIHVQLLVKNGFDFG